MLKSKFLSIIIDAPFIGEIPTNAREHVHLHHPFENYLLASQQKGGAKDIANDLGFPGQGNYILLSPVFFYTTHNDVFMTGVVNEAEEQQIFDALSKFIKADGFSLHRYQKHLWLLHAPEMPSLESEILPLVMHQSLKPYLDQWPLFWRRWFTEVQMLLNPLSLLSANGVWLWGQGQLNSLPRCRTFAIEHDINFPRHLLQQQQTALQSGDIVITSPQHLDKLQRYLKNFRHVHFLWQNCDYWQRSTTLWQKLTRWWQVKCK